MNDYQDRYKVVFLATVVSSSTNLFLAISKIVAGFYGASHALIADGLHSLSDLCTDLLVYFTTFFSVQDADEKHPYGHAKVETIGTTVLAIILFITALGIIYGAIIKALSTNHLVPNKYVLIFVVVSIILNECLYRYTTTKAKQINSQLLIANAWHHRQDAASSVVVLIGVIGSLFGFFYLEIVAAIIIALMIGKMSFYLIWKGLNELMDAAVEDRLLHQIRRIILQVDGVVDIHQLRSRCIADQIFIDIHVLVLPMITVSEGHYISRQIQINLKKKISKKIDILVHIDPENDEKVIYTLNLKSRTEIIKNLLSAWKSLKSFDNIKDIKLHYLAGKVIVEVYLPYSELDSIDVLKQRQLHYIEAVSDFNYIETVMLFYGGSEYINNSSIQEY